LTWSAELPNPVGDGDTAVYPDVWPGVDLRVRALPAGLSYLLVVKTRQALAIPALRRVTVGTAGPATRPRIDGGLDVVAPDGSTLLSAGPASMWDSRDGATATGPGDRSRTAPVRVEVDGANLSLVPDEAMMAEPHLVLPLYLDPQIVAPRVRWAYADTSGHNINDGVARVGLNPDGTGTYRSFFEFGLGQLARTHILSAKFETTLLHSYSCDPTPVSLYASGGIDAGVNGTRTTWSPPLGAWLDTQWGNAHKMTDNVKTCANDPQPNMAMTFVNLLAANLQSWVNQSFSGVTLALTAHYNGTGESAGERWKKFDPGQTRLIVSYNSIPGTPDPAALSTVASSQTGACWTGATTGQPWVNSATGVRLRATLTDGDSGDALVARFEWQDVTAGTAVVALPDTPGFAPPHTYEALLAADPLPQGHSVRWRVHGFDGTDNGAPSPWCQFAVDNASPGQPTLTSTDLPPFPSSPPPSATVGTPARVTATPAVGDTDIVGYYVGVGAVETAPTVWVAARADGTAVIPVVPVVSGLNKNFLTVVAVDRAGNRSPVPVSAPDAPGTRQFRANPDGTGPGVRADITGDGKADVVGVYDAGNGVTQLWQHLTTADGTGVLGPTVPIANDPNAFPLNRVVPLSGDFNGDGHSDVAILRDDGSCRVSLWWWLADGNTYRPSPDPLWAAAPNTWCFSSSKPVAGDFTGDGKADIAVFYNYAGSLTRILVFATKPDGTGVNAPVEWWYSGPGVWDWSHTKPVAADYDGDGRTDIAAFYDYNDCTSGLFVFASTGSGFAWPARPWLSGARAWCWSLSTPVAGDFTGDGRTDFAVMYRYSATLWRIFVWTGGDLTTPVQAAQSTTSTDVNLMRLVSGDVNGDGRADVGFFYNHGNQQTKLWWLISGGTTFTAETVRWDSGPGGLDWNRFVPA